MERLADQLPLLARLLEVPKPSTGVMAATLLGASMLLEL
jgi:hypothetical protein